MQNLNPLYDPQKYYEQREKFESVYRKHGAE